MDIFYEWIWGKEVSSREQDLFWIMEYRYAHRKIYENSRHYGYNEDNFMCLQEIKWTAEKAEELDNSKFKFWYTRKVRIRNGMGIIVDSEWNKDIVDNEWNKDIMDMKRVEDKIMALKFIVKQDKFNVISAYAPQFGLA